MAPDGDAARLSSQLDHADLGGAVPFRTSRMCSPVSLLAR